MGHNGTQHLRFMLGLEGTRWEGHVGTDWDTLGHKIWAKKMYTNAKFGTENLGHKVGHKMEDKGTQHFTLALEGTRWDVGTRRNTKSGTPNLGHKIWNTKFGTENLGHKIWDTKWETRGHDTLPWGHNGTQHLRFTLGLREGTCWDTARWDTLGQIGTR